jgi:quinohemoprotein ethanol dehydrogenase
MQAPKNGFFYVLDRLTGELLSATPYAHVNWASGIDMRTGRPIETAHARYSNRVTTIAPGPGGAHNFQPMSFNPETGLVYIPANEGTFAYVNDAEFEFIPRHLNFGIDLGTRVGLPLLSAAEYGRGVGEQSAAPSVLVAWDPVARQARWRVPSSTVQGGGTLTTAGNLVFHGAADGRFIAYSADQGAKLWEIDLGHGIVGTAASYALDGNQYVSILVGWGGIVALYGANPAGQYKAQGRLYTFMLDGSRDIPRIRGIDKPALTAIANEASPEQMARGANLFAQRCSSCHGIAAASGGMIADLRYASPATYEMFDAIVREGAYQPLGMPMFDWLGADDVRAIRSYVLAQRAALLSDE